jgi:hypothetical protein
MKQEEAAIQAAIVAHFRKTYAGRAAHVPNGGWRGKLEAVRLKQMGVEAGHPDLVFYTPKGVFLIEVKTSVGALSGAQNRFVEDLQNLGFDVAIIRSVDEGKAALAAWGLPKKEPTRRSEVEIRTGF